MIDNRSGVIVIGRDVRVAVAQGNLTVTISETPQVSQPSPFSRGRTRVVPRNRGGGDRAGRRACGLGAAGFIPPASIRYRFLNRTDASGVTRH